MTDEVSSYESYRRLIKWEEQDDGKVLWLKYGGVALEKDDTGLRDIAQHLLTRVCDVSRCAKLEEEARTIWMSWKAQYDHLQYRNCIHEEACNEPLPGFVNQTTQLSLKMKWGEILCKLARTRHDLVNWQQDRSADET